MGDNISRKAALAYPLSWDHYDKEHGNRHFICGVESYREYIASLPSTDRTGEWLPIVEKYDDTKYLTAVRCSCCKKVKDLAHYKDSFCPECGADMRGGAE